MRMPSQAHPVSSSVWSSSHSSHFRPQVKQNNSTPSQSPSHSGEKVKSSMQQTSQQQQQHFQPTYSIMPTVVGPFGDSHSEGGKPQSQQPQKLPASLRNLNIRERLADFREQVRNEDLVLKSGAIDDQKALKNHVGGWAFTPEQMAHLKVTPYEYNASAGSYLELLVLQRFWIWLATFIPPSIAPCSITAAGFAINLLTCSILIAYSPDAKAEVPRWTLALAALGVFLYQIADALDGKQCYKVQNTQIEEFYDHGCDAVSTILLMYATAIATQCGHYPALTLTVLFGSLVAFYSTHWQCYVTEQMVFGKIDVTEAQWSMILIHLTAAIFGQSIWSSSTLSLGLGVTLTLTQVLALLSLASLANAILSNAAIVLLGVPTPLEKAGVSIPRRLIAPNKPVLPVAALSTLAVIAYKLGYFHLNPTMYVLAFGFAYAKLTMKLVIAHCTKSELDLSDPSLFVPLLLVLNHFSSLGPLILPGKALLCALICNTVELIRYFTCVSWDMRVALEVDIFAVRYPPDHPKSRRHCGGYYVNGLNNSEVLKRK